jgi:hypothetical protein
VTHLQVSLARPAVLDHEHAPGVAAPEQRARRDLQHVAALPHDDADFDAIAIADRSRLVHEVADHVDPLLFHAKRRHLGEP